MRKLIFFLSLSLGVVALMVGGIGLLTPVSISPEEQTVHCGSAISPDLSAARSKDDGSDANTPILDVVVVDIDYTRLCQKDLQDRRQWTISLAVFGALAIAGSLVYRVRTKRSPPSQ